MNKWSGAIFLPALIGLNAYVLMAWDAEWRGQWQATFDIGVGTTVLTAPLTAAFAAHLVLSQSGLRELSETTGRGDRVVVRCAMQSWAWAASAYVVTALVAVCITGLMPHGGPVQWWAVLVGIPALAVGAIGGALAAQVFPHRLTVVVVGPALFLVCGFAPAPLVDVLRLEPGEGTGGGIEFVPRMWGLQMLALVGLVGLLIVGSLRFWERRVISPVSLAALGLGATMLGASLVAIERAGIDRFRVSGERPTVCAGAAPQICVSPSERRALRETASQMRVAIDELREIGITFPDRYEEQLPGYVPPIGTGVITWTAGAGPLSLERAAQNVVDAGACPAWRDPAEPPPERAFEGQALVVAWVRLRAGEQLDWATMSTAEARWLKGVDLPAAQEVVRRIFDHLRQCELDSIRVPWRSDDG